MTPAFRGSVRRNLAGLRRIVTVLLFVPGSRKQDSGD
jgi:hypothetical protein